MVGGAAHEPATSEDFDDTDEPISLAEAVDDLEARVAQSRPDEVVVLDMDEDIDGVTENNDDSDLDDYPNRSPSEPESQV